MTLQLGWFSTGRGRGSYGMLERALQAIDSGDLDARLQFVFSNRERGEGEGSDQFFDLVESRGIPLVHHSSPKFRRAHDGKFDAYRQEYDARVLELLADYSPDLCVLAGYLLIFGPELCRSFTHINMHPALPDGPKGLWQSVIWDLIGGRASETGAMVFLVTEEVDEGPPIAFTRFALRGPRFDELWSGLGDTPVSALRERDGEEYPLFQAIRQEGVRREPVLLLETVKGFARGELRIVNGRVLDASGQPALPRDLTAQVEAALGIQ
jgi:phosphoribosylglycinamide formyltransferase-1